MAVLLNFHYSDFWADPGKQIKPKAWEGYSVEELEKAVYDYTEEMMKIFKENGVNLTMVQVGNELSNGLLWPEGRVPNYDNIARFVNAGIRAGPRSRYRTQHNDPPGQRRQQRALPGMV